MRRFHKFNTVFYKLIFSYTIIISVTIIFVGITFYLYFSTKFNEQVEKVNYHILAHLKQTIEDNIIKKVEATYLDLVADTWQDNPAIFLFDHPIEGNHPTINAVYQQLNAIVNFNAELFDSIGIYYEDHNIVISSSSGISYLKDDVTVDLSWLSVAKQTKKTAAWMEARQVAANVHSDSGRSDIVTFVSPYPFTSKKDKVKGYIAFHLKESAFHSIIQSIAPYENSQFYLLNDEGNLITHSNHSVLFNGTADYPYIQDILHAQSDNEDFIIQADGVETLVSYAVIPGVQWKIINHTPVNEFYKSTTPIRNTLIVICLLAIVIGLLVSNFFTKNIYQPLKTIIQGTRQLFGNQPLPIDTNNEYQIIDNVINNLSIKVSKLKDTLETNMPLIKHNLITGLLHNTITHQNELDERLRLLNMKLTGDSFLSLTFHLDIPMLNTLSIESRQYIKYDLIHFLETNSTPDTLLLATDLAENQICTLACTENDTFDAIVTLVRNAVGYISSSFNIDAVAVIGSPVTDPLMFHRSYKDSLALMKYHYFLPEQRILYGDELLARENSSEEIPEEYVERMASSLRTNDIQIIKKEVSNVLSLMQAGNFSADHCHQKLRDMITVFRSYLKDIYLKTEEAVGTERLEHFKFISNINQFEGWLLQVIEACSNSLNDRQKNKNSAIIEKAKSYILDNIDASLSLDTVAEHILLSPRYLSKLFREETGIHFTDFITSARIEKARELILSTNDTIEQISYKVGFNSSAYFIKKFKENYGVTPKNFKHNFQMQSS
ncbi:helix-turn-helix domain-containing protein [Paenibacillus sp. IITD108]|uniref:helix-turn-helix domain-containing protein n=1 Tax=Paenibacillus sp. IITD108 TaxID=3116649 RepID=UPI002F3FBEC9